jgi:hypothetical protein
VGQIQIVEHRPHGELIKPIKTHISILGPYFEKIVHKTLKNPYFEIVKLTHIYILP